MTTARFECCQPTPDVFTRSVFKDFGEYVGTVCDWVDVDVCEVMSPIRERRVCDLRHVLMYVGRKEFQMLTTEVGRFFNRDHTCVVHAVNKLHNLSEVGAIGLLLGDYLHAAEQVFINQMGEQPNSIQWLTTKK